MSFRMILGSFQSIVKQDLQLALRRPWDFLTPLLFYLLVITLFPLAITPDPAKLSTLAPGIIWIAALLSMLLSFHSLFYNDYEDGSLEQWCLSSCPLALIASAKILVHWITTALPLICLSPILAQLLFLPKMATGVLIVSLLLGTPTLCFLGAVVAALTLGLRQGGVLLTLLVLPLYVPVLIFGAGSVMNAFEHLPFAGEIAFLGALLSVSLTVAPFVIAAALRVGVS